MFLFDAMFGHSWGREYPRGQVGAVLAPSFQRVHRLVLPVTCAMAWGNPADCKIPMSEGVRIFGAVLFY